MSPGVHRWTIFRAGGVDQVAIETGEDLRNLAQLDPKLWIALSMPTRGVELDQRTLDLLDTDGDGHIRHPELLAAIAWADTACKDLGDLLSERDAVELARLRDDSLRATARSWLDRLGKPGATAISLADTAEAEKILSGTVSNGDGVVALDSMTGDQRAIADDIAATLGTVTDRSGTPGIDRERVDRYFADALALAAWHDRADSAVLPLGAATAEAAAAVRAVRGKIDDFFVRCSLANFDERATSAMNAGDAQLAALSQQELSLGDSALANLPIAQVRPNGALPLAAGINPAWRARITALVDRAVTPILGPRTSLSEAEWRTLVDAFAAHERWRDARPSTPLTQLAPERLRAATAGDHAAALRLLIDHDRAAQTDLDGIQALEKLCRLCRDFRTIVTNYVNFSQFYRQRESVFQAGTLYIDGRGCKLTFEVVDATKHHTMAPLAGVCLAYCECARDGAAPRYIAAALTAGDVDNLQVGRNGVFVDRAGRDWEATVTKLIEAPISIRQAFWSPYKKLVRLVEERAAARAASAEAAVDAKTGGLATSVADGKPPEKKKIDVGTVAALGVAVGGIAAVVTALVAGIIGLGPWMPIGLGVLFLAISTPSMVLAYMKLRRRNLGPLLDAGGWAINALTRINLPLGTSLTETARLPAGAVRDLRDPFPESGPPWALYLALVVLVAAAVTWCTGRVDKYLPTSVRTSSVFPADPAATPPTP